MATSRNKQDLVLEARLSDLLTKQVQQMARIFEREASSISKALEQTERANVKAGDAGARAAERIEVNARDAVAAEQALGAAAVVAAHQHEVAASNQVQNSEEIKRELGTIAVSTDLVTYGMQEAGESSQQFGTKARESFRRVEESALEAVGSIDLVTYGLAEVGPVGKKAGDVASEALRKVGRDASDATKKAQSDMRRLLVGVLAIGGGFSTAFAARSAITSVAAFEQGLVGVGKTTNIAGDELKSLGIDVLELSSRIPVATQELLDIAQAAGQLGITGSANLVKFTDTVAKLGTASDLQGDAAATTLARLLNVTGESVESVDKLGSVIVRLGNEFAASESEIAANATRVGQAGAAYGITSAQAVALATAMRALGTEAELGGTQFGLLLQAITKAVAGGGDELDRFAKIAGTSAEEFRNAFRASSFDGFLRFIEGLGKLDIEDQVLAFESLGLEGARAGQVFGPLAVRFDTLAATVESMNDELENTAALETEAARGADTLQGDWTRLLNTTRAIAISTGEAGLLGTLRGIVQTVSDVLRASAGLETGFQGSRAQAEFLATALEAVAKGATAFVAVKLTASLALVTAGLFTTAGAAGTASVALGGLSLAVSPVTAAAVAVGALVAVLSSIEGPAEIAERRMRALTLSVREAGEATNAYASAQTEFNAALRSGDLDAQERAVRKQIDAIEELVESQRELSTQRAGGLVEIGVLTSISGISREDVQRQLTETLGGALDVDLKLGKGVTKELAGEVLDTLGQLPVADLGGRFGITARDSQIEQLQAALASLVESTGDAGAALDALYGRAGVAEKLPESVAIEALIGLQQKLGERLRGLDEQRANAASAIRGEVDAYAALTDEQRDAVTSLQEMAQAIRDETRLLGVSGDERRALALEIRAEKIARDVGLESVESYIAAIRREIAAQEQTIERRKEIARSFATLGVAYAQEAASASAVQTVLERLPLVYGLAASAARKYQEEQGRTGRFDAAEQSLERQRKAVEELSRLRESLQFEVSVASVSDADAQLEADLARVRELARAAGIDANAAAREFEGLFLALRNGDAQAEARFQALASAAQRVRLSFEDTQRIQVALIQAESRRVQEQLRLNGAAEEQILAVAAAYRQLARDADPASFTFGRGAGDALDEFVRFAENDAQQAFDLVNTGLQSTTQGFGRAVVAWASGAQTMGDAFRALATDVLTNLAQMLATQAAVDALGGIFSSFGAGASDEAGKGLVDALAQAGIDQAASAATAAATITGGGTAAGTALTTGATTAAGTLSAAGTTLAAAMVQGATSAAAILQAAATSSTTTSAVGSAAGAVTFANGGVIPGGIDQAASIPSGVQWTAFANGGIVPGGLGPAIEAASAVASLPTRYYAAGGPIMREPHVAVMGEGRYDEAVVPLPNGRSIPVDVRSSGRPSRRDRDRSSDNQPVTVNAPVTLNVGSLDPRQAAAVILDPANQRAIRAALASALQSGVDAAFNRSVRSA